MSEEEFVCGEDEPHQYEQFPGDRHDRCRCIVCGDLPPDQPDGFYEV